MARKRKRPLVLVSNLEPGMEIDGYFLVRQITPGAGSGPKLRGRVWDRSGEASLISWTWDRDAFLPDGAYRIVGTVNTYAGSLQICADHIEPCPTDVDIHDLLPAAPRPADEMWADLERLCCSMTRPELGALLRLCLEDGDLCERWRRAPAAARHHHAYAGGLLEHTLGVARLALVLAEQFPSVDRDLLLAGALLHDIGKTEAYHATGLPDMTDRGRLLGHVYPGVRLVENLVERLPGFCPELRDRLLHLVGSHHGDRQFGVLEVPRTPEAILLHYADNLDAKMQAVLTACSQARGQPWTAPVRSLGEERIYLGKDGEAPPPPEADGVLDLMAGGLFSEGMFCEDDFDR